MMKHYRGLLWSIAALAILVGALLAALYWLPEKQAPAAQDNAAVITVMSIPAAAVRELSVTNAAGTLQAVREGASLSVPSLKGFPLDKTRLDALLANAIQLTALREIDVTGKPLADFGLEPPAATVVVTSTVGVETYEVGREAPASLGSYVRYGGKVFLVNTAYASVFLRGEADYLSRMVAEELAHKEEQLGIKLECGGDRISLVYVPAEERVSGSGSEAVTETIKAYYIAEEPAPAVLTYDEVTRWSWLPAGFDASEVAALRPNAATLAEFGLDKPDCTLSYVTSSGRSVTLHSKDAGDGSCYLMRDGVDAIFRTEREYTAWMNVTPETLFKTLFVGVKPDAVRAITITPAAGAGCALERGTAGFDAAAAALLALAPAYTAPVEAASLPELLRVRVAFADGRETELVMHPSGKGSLLVFADGAPARLTVPESAAGELTALCAAGGG